ncbi:caspase domain-containing protein [Mycena polygramma]|nr:caspase domain-containing protein [Mycena polygramma]
MPSEGRRWFLLSIAINQYQCDKIPQLQGCLNDAELLKLCLSSILGTPSKTAIRSLTNAQATRSAIISGFSEHLINNSEIEYGDPIVIFYAGHGGRVPAPGGAGLPSRFIETLCPADQSVKDGTPGIPDVTVNALLRILAGRKGSNITFICDCCHSGGVDREITAEQHGYRVARYNEHNPPLSPLPDIDLEILEKANGQGEAFHHHGSYLSHILLAACGENEKAFEVPEPFGTTSGGRYPCGAFTEALTRRLGELQSSWQHVTYSSLFDSLTLENQNPRCVGDYGNCFLFSNKRARGLFNLTEVPTGFHVDAGRAHGLCVGTKLNVYKQAAASPCLGVLEVDTVAPLSATAKRRSVDNTFDVPAPSWAGIRAWDAGDLRVFASPSVAKSLRLPDFRSAFSLLRAHDRESSHIALYSTSDGYITVERRDPLMGAFSCRSVTLNLKLLVGLSLSDALQKIAHFYFHLGRHKPTSSEAFLDSNNLTMTNRVFVRMNHVVRDNEGLSKLGSHVTFRKNIFYLEEEEGCDYSLTIYNTSNHGFYLYLFYLNPADYSITPWCLPQPADIEPSLKPHSSLSIGDGYRNTLHFAPGPDGADGGFFKLILCSRYVDLGHIAQESLFKEVPSTQSKASHGRDRMPGHIGDLEVEDFSSSSLLGLTFRKRPGWGSIFGWRI